MLLLGKKGDIPILIGADGRVSSPVVNIDGSLVDSFTMGQFSHGSLGQDETGVGILVDGSDIDGGVLVVDSPAGAAQGRAVLDLIKSCNIWPGWNRIHCSVS